MEMWKLPREIGERNGTGLAGRMRYMSVTVGALRIMRGF